MVWIKPMAPSTIWVNTSIKLNKNVSYKPNWICKIVAMYDSENQSFCDKWNSTHRLTFPQLPKVCSSLNKQVPVWKLQSTFPVCWGEIHHTNMVVHFLIIISQPISSYPWWFRQRSFKSVKIQLLIILGFQGLEISKL